MKITEDGINFLTTKSITKTEVRIIDEVLTGDRSRAIANRLNITEKTVKFHLTNIYRKLAVKNRPQLITSLGIYNKDIPSPYRETLKETVIPEAVPVLPTVTTASIVREVASTL